MKTGRCACESVRYEVIGELEPVTYCHCSKCRRWHGHVGAWTAVERAGFRLVDERGLKWHAMNANVRRGLGSRSSRLCAAELRRWSDGRDQSTNHPRFGMAARMRGGLLGQSLGLRQGRHQWPSHFGRLSTVDVRYLQSTRDVRPGRSSTAVRRCRNLYRSTHAGVLLFHLAGNGVVAR
jgi:hypothetical protein